MVEPATSPALCRNCSRTRAQFIFGAMAFYRRRFGRVRHGFSRSRRAFGFRRRLAFRRYGALPRPFRRGADLGRRSAQPRVYRYTNTWDGGSVGVTGASDTLVSTQFFMYSSGFGALSLSYAQYRIDEVSVTLMPGWTVTTDGTFTGGSAGIAQPYVVSSCNIGPTATPGGSGTVQAIMNCDDAYRTDGPRPHTRTFRPSPSAEAYNSALTSGYYVPGGTGGRRSVWVSCDYPLLPHGSMNYGIRCPGGSSAATMWYRITYTMKISFRYFRGDLTTAPLGGVAVPPRPGPRPESDPTHQPAMVTISPPGMWVPCTATELMITGAGAPGPAAAGGAGASSKSGARGPFGVGAGVTSLPPADDDDVDDEYLDELADEVARGARLRRHDTPLRSTPGTRAAAARRAESIDRMFAPKA